MNDWPHRERPRSQGHASSLLFRAKELGCYVAFCAALLLVSVDPAIAQDAPYGLSWGPVDKIPRPSTAEREANITALVYRGDTLPTGTADTSEIVLEVCANEGLQSVIWVSRPLSESEGKQKWAAIIAEGDRRHDAHVAGPDVNRVSWPSQRTSAVFAHASNGVTHILMMSGGPSFDTCSASHFNATNHTLPRHFEETVKRIESKNVR